jgi:septum formation inhibitor-activating ATPase MinD
MKKYLIWYEAANSTREITLRSYTIANILFTILKGNFKYLICENPSGIRTIMKER